jgi:hypothetical protein
LFGLVPFVAALWDSVQGQWFPGSANGKFHAGYQQTLGCPYHTRIGFEWNDQVGIMTIPGLRMQKLAKRL